MIDGLWKLKKIENNKAEEDIWNREKICFTEDHFSALTMTIEDMAY